MKKQNFIEIKNKNLTFNFNELKDDNVFSINFNRTLRIPSDDKKYALPPGLGHFLLQHVEDFKGSVPESWNGHGGVFFPMYQAEAMWMQFRSPSGRPFAVKVASGKVNAVSGKPWVDHLEGNGSFTVFDIKNQDNQRRVSVDKKLKAKIEPDYMVAPNQPWLDGFNVGEGVIRQFIAVPLESGYTVEEQVTGKAEVGGLQIIVYPMKDEAWNKIKASGFKYHNKEEMGSFLSFAGESSETKSMSMAFNMASKGTMRAVSLSVSVAPDMGLGAGGKIKQEIFENPYGIDAWDTDNSLRIFVHLANSIQYKNITGVNPPTRPPSAETYGGYGYPWFNFYSDDKVLKGSDILSLVKSISELEDIKGGSILPDNGHKPGKNQKPIALGKKTVKNGKW